MSVHPCVINGYVVPEGAICGIKKRDLKKCNVSELSIGNKFGLAKTHAKRNTVQSQYIGTMRTSRSVTNLTGRTRASVTRAITKPLITKKTSTPAAPTWILYSNASEK